MSCNEKMNFIYQSSWQLLSFQLDDGNYVFTERPLGSMKEVLSNGEF